MSGALISLSALRQWENMACLELCIRLTFGHVLDGLSFLIKNKELLDADLSGGVKGLSLCPHIGAVEGHQSH